MNHKPRTWSAKALNTTHRTARQMVPNQRLAKWPEADCKAMLDRPRRKRLNPTAIPQGTRSRMTRTMLMRAARYTN
jgi:hypothetical protein